jgi:mRNA interferase MazF
MFERGDLLLVPFPFSDLSATKQRPVLALTALDE